MNFHKDKHSIRNKFNFGINTEIIKNSTDNLIHNYLENSISQINIEIINKYSYEKLSKIITSGGLKLQDENNIFQVKEIISLIQNDILERITEEKESFFEIRNIVENSKTLTKLKIFEKWMREMNVNERELLIMCGLYQNNKNIGDNPNDKDYYLENINQIKQHIYSSFINSKLYEKINKSNKELRNKIDKLKEEIKRENQLEEALIVKIKSN